MGMRRAATVLAAIAASLTVVAAATPAQAANAMRWSGSDRYATAAYISAQSFAAPAPVVFVATGGSFPDALAAGPAAAQLGGPVLLVSDTIPAPTAAELTRLAPQRIVVVGGTSTIPASVQTALGAYAPTVDRWAGPDRYATAAAISANTFDPGVPDVFVATGANFPDALSGAAAASYLHAPVLLVPGTSIPAAVTAELTRLAPSRITILGGTASVSAAVADQLAGYTTGQVRRLSGPDRYATSQAISAAVFTSASSVLLATGQNFPDAVAGGPAAGRHASPILLTQQACLSDAAADEITRLGADTVILLGGTSALGPGVGSLTRCSQYTPPAPPPPLSCTASMSDTSPHQQSNVYVNVTTLPDASIQASAHYKTTTTTHYGTANRSGHGSVEFETANATIGYTVRVDVTVSLGGHTATCSTSFTTA